MKLLKLVLIVVVTVVLYEWINDCGEKLTVADLVPFSVRGHSFPVNYLGVVMIGLTIWRLYAWRK